MNVSQIFFKTPNKTLKFLEKSKKMHFTTIYRPKFQKSSLQCLPWGNPMKPLN